MSSRKAGHKQATGRQPFGGFFMSRNKRKRLAIERAQKEHRDTIRDIEQGRNAIISKRQAKAGKLGRRAIRDHETNGGISHFLPAVHQGDSACLIKGRTWVKRRHCCFRKDQMRDLENSQLTEMRRV